MEEPSSKRAVTVEVPGDGNAREKRLGADLDEVLREILDGLKEERGWENWSEAAERLGLTQQALNNFRRRRNGFTLSTLSKMCAALQLDPTALFARHAHYAARRQFAADFTYDQFRDVLDRGEAARLLPLLRAQKDRGALDSFLTWLESSTSAPATAASRRKHRRKNAN